MVSATKKKTSKKQSNKYNWEAGNPLPKFIFTGAFILLVALTIYLYGAYAIGIVSLNDFNTWGSMSISLLFPTGVFAYFLGQGKSMKQSISELGLSRNKLNLRAIGWGVVLFFIIFGTEIAISIISYVSGVPLPTNVTQVLSGTPVYFLIFGIVVSPFNEETLFRGFLLPRIGILLQAFIFALLHTGYLSISEFVGAFVFGLAAGYVMKRTTSLYSTMTGHFLVNFVSIAALVLSGQL
ncbi:MAG: CPBP family intramembrane metalloprotease [Candidatus Marsarchaeota archaeon]|nr:CPBP family intramembrane metalloprotease [Candidatus Marsarchaeota archaeon]